MFAQMTLSVGGEKGAVIKSQKLLYEMKSLIAKIEY